MGELDTQDAAQLIRTLSVIFLNLVPADAEESLSMTTELFLGYISKMVNVFSLLYEYTDNNNGSVAL